MRSDKEQRMEDGTCNTHAKSLRFCSSFSNNCVVKNSMHYFFFKSAFSDKAKQESLLEETPKTISLPVQYWSSLINNVLKINGNELKEIKTLRCLPSF